MKRFIQYALLAVGLTAIPLTAKAGTITGTVTGPSAQPLEGITVVALQGWDWRGSTETGADGSYSIGSLATGTYQIQFRDNHGGNYATEFYDDAPYLGAATDVPVVSGETTGNIDASLALAGKIGGTVTGPDGVTPLAGIEIDALVWTGQWWDWLAMAETGADGSYLMVGLPAGACRIQFLDKQNGNYVTEFYNDVQDAFDAVDVNVTAGATVGNINASLAQAGKIGGTVTGPDGVTPLEGIWVMALVPRGDGGWDSVGGTETGADGTYLVGGLPPGTYRVQFEDWQNGQYASEYYDSVTNYDDATDVNVVAGSTTGNINASLALAGKISGTVTGPDGVTPLEGIEVSAQVPRGDGGWDSVGRADTGADGSYLLGGLPAGTYRVEFQDWQNGQYVSECYDNAPNLDDATDVNVVAGSTTGNINASLALAGKISGTVTGPDGVTPLEGIEVNALVQRGDWWDYVGWVETGADGSYLLGGLSPGTYRVAFQDWQNGQYATEYYDNASNPDDATEVSVVAGSTTGNINASLALAGKIAGTVTGPNGVTPLEGIEVAALVQMGEDRWDSAGWAQTGADGSYLIGGLPSGTYRVQFQDWENGQYASEYYDNAPNQDDATDVPVVAGSTTDNIDASLALAGKIGGTVTGPNGVTPLEGIDVAALVQTGEDRWDSAGWAQTGADGSYLIGGLPSGTYRVQFQDWENGQYASEYYDNAPNQDDATDVPVVAGSTTGNINASLALAGRIAGTVTGPNGVTPLEGIDVEARQGDQSVGWAATDAEGHYTIQGLPAGAYGVEFRDYNGMYASEHYPQLVDVVAGATTENIDASLALAGKIQGTVTGPGGVPLQDIEVAALFWLGGEWKVVEDAGTDANGQYELGGLLPGTYRVEFNAWANNNYAREIYDNVSSLSEGADIVVQAGQTVSNIDASLAVASKIRGTVTGPGAVPLQGITAVAFLWTGAAWDPIASDEEGSGADGRYELGGLAAGTYRVAFWDMEVGTYAGVWHPDQLVLATGQTLDNINGSLTALGGAISGTVTGPGGVPELEAEVWAYQWTEGQWLLSGVSETDAMGNYVLRGLAPGNYRVQFASDNLNLAVEVYNNAVNLDAGTDVAVLASQTHAGINAELGYAAGDVAMPVFNPDGGAQPGSSVNVTVSCSTASATIRYTTNGSEPTEASSVVASGSAVSVPVPGTLKAKAWKVGLNPSATKSASYTAAGTVATPTFSPDGSAQPGSSVNVTVSCSTASATIRYTTNGSEPTEASSVVASGSAVSVPVPGTLKAKAWKVGLNPSATKSASYTAAVSSWDTGYVDLGGGWRRLAWFGDYVPMGGDGWIWHSKHGFFFVPSNAQPANMWIYAQDMGWLWTGNATYPFLYRLNDGAWLWYNGSRNPRWFVNMATGRWERWP